MLQLLDTAIAFSVVMLMLSLLITAVVQAISGILNMRGRNLADHLEMLLNQISPELRDQNSKGTFRSWWKFWDEKKPKKVTALIADAIVAHPSLAQGAKGVTTVWTKAKAIRSDELVAVLKDLASGKTPVVLDENAKSALTDFVRRTIDPSGKLSKMMTDAKTAIGSANPTLLHELETIAAQALPAATNPGGELDKLRIQMEAALGSQHGDLQKALTGLINEASSKLSGLEKSVDEWFDTVMSRSSDVFQRFTRGITIAAAIVLTFAFQIDSGKILHQLYTNAEMRSSFVKMAGDVSKRAEEILRNGKFGSDAVSAVRSQEENSEAEARKAKESATGEDAVKADSALAQHKQNVDALTKVPPDLSSCSLLDEWAKKDAPQLRTQLQSACQDEVKKAVSLDVESINTLTKGLKDSELQIMGWDSTKGWQEGYKNNPLHWIGVLATFVLLSLGAPFWFNILRQVSNLKPTIAAQVGQEEAVERAAETATCAKAKAKQ